MAKDLGLVEQTLREWMNAAKAGKLRVLATTSSRRSAAAPQYPTIAEAGVEGYSIDFWFGLLVPAGTPEEFGATIKAEIEKCARIVKSANIRLQ